MSSFKMPGQISKFPPASRRALLRLAAAASVIVVPHKAGGQKLETGPSLAYPITSLPILDN
jgi:hypothetical protein